jgi:hypothetical protein
MLKFNKIWNFLLKINKYIINFILDLFNILILSIIYFFVFGPTVIITKLFRITFFKKYSKNVRSYWEKINGKDKLNDYYKQY